MECFLKEREMGAQSYEWRNSRKFLLEQEGNLQKFQTNESYKTKSDIIANEII